MELSTDISIDLVCAECGASLDGTQHRNDLTISVTPCKKCLEAAEEEGAANERAKL